MMKHSLTYVRLLAKSLVGSSEHAQSFAAEPKETK
jgi:hypothetical protein